MPYYTYKCPDCGDTQTIDHGMMDDPVVICAKCNVDTKKVPGVGAVSFKGGGWGKDAR